MMKNHFENQVVIITGASAGIGRALAINASRQGAKVVLAARRVEKLQQTADECHQGGGEVLVVPTDVADELQCRNLVEKTVQTFGRVDMLINNAGMAVTALLQDFSSLDLFRKTMDVNLYGAVYCTYYALPYLKQTRGRIVAVSSLGGKATIPYNTPYCTSKFGMHGFFDALRMELFSSGVSVTIVCPSWVATEFHAAQLNQNGTPRGQEAGADYYSSRTMSADRCARLILKAAHRRKREIWMGAGWATVWLKLLAPGLLDWIAVKLFLGSAVRRAVKARQSRNVSGT